MWSCTHLPSWRQILLTVCCVAVLGGGGAKTVAAPAAPSASERSAPDPQDAQPLPEGSVPDPQDAEPSASAQEWDSLCKNMGSDLCLMWERGANDAGSLEAWYQKAAGPHATSPCLWRRAITPHIRCTRALSTPAEPARARGTATSTPARVGWASCGSALPSGPPRSCTPRTPPMRMGPMGTASRPCA